MGISSKTSPSPAVIDPSDETAVKSFKEMLAFYGVQLQSHASVMIAIAILVFGVIQAWGALPLEFKSAPYHSMVFSVTVGIMGLGFVFELLRLYVYGQLASGMMYASTTDFNLCKDQYIARYKEEQPERWRVIFDLTKVSVYAQWFFERNARILLRLKVFDRSLHVRAWVLGVAFVTSLLVSYGLIFGTPDLQDLMRLSEWWIPIVTGLLMARSVLKW